MSLAVKPVFEAMARRFRTQTSDARFGADFVYSVNVVLDELSSAADLATPLAHIESTTASVSELSAATAYILDAGLDYYLMLQGHKRAGDSTSELGLARANWEDRKGDLLMHNLRTTMATVDADGVPTADIVGLGYREG